MANYIQPKISVIICTQKTPLMILKRCIMSIRNQTLSDIEIILLDSNEPDSPYKKAIKNESTFFQNICYIEIPEDGEYAYGKNAALSQCTGKYVTIISAQDTMPPRRLECIYQEFCNDPKKGLIYTNMINQDYNILDESDFSFFSSRFQYLSQFIFLKELITLSAPFDTQLIAHRNQDFCLRLQMTETPKHIINNETTISITTECFYQYEPLQSAIGYRQLLVKYKSYFKNKKNRQKQKEIYQLIAKKYKEAHLFFRYLQFQVKYFFCN